MAIAQSKVTAQGQISVPAEVRKKLGIGPGSTLEWDQLGDQVIVRRAGRHPCDEIHAALFPEGVSQGIEPVDTKAGIRRHIQRRYARR